MKHFFPFLSLLVVLVLALPASAQSQSATVSAASVPMLVRFSGVVENAAPLRGTTGVTCALYKEQQGGAALWVETQTVELDPAGRYNVVLGATKPEGLPAELFTSGEARWLGVQIAGREEQPRVLLLSVPYALKAGDAATVGGLAPSAFVLAAPPASNSSGAAANSPPAVNSASAPPPTTSNVTTTGGTGNTIAMYTTATNIQNSILTQTGTTTINVNGKLILPPTGTATALKGYISQPNNYVASVFNSGTASAVNEKFLFQTEPVGNNTTTPSGSLHLLFGSGTSAPVETGLKISAAGIVSFAAGQTFPGTGSGTVTSVASGAGLTGGPITTSGALAIAPAGVTNAMLASPSLTVTAGTDLTGGGSVALGGTTTLNLDTTKVPQLGTNNIFTGNQSITGNLNVSGIVGIGTTAPSQKLEVDRGNLLVRGSSNFTTAGNTAFVYVGDTNHPIEALYNSGLAIGAFKVPAAVFIQDKTGNVGIGTTAPAGTLDAITANSLAIAGVFDNAGGGQILSLRNNGIEKLAVQNNGIVQIGTTSTSGMLNAVSNSQSLVGLYVNGFSAPLATYVDGTTALFAAGGSANTDGENSGGGGVVAYGGEGYIGGSGGTGIVGIGGGRASGGGAGGGFAGGPGKDADGDGIDASPGNNVGGAYAGSFNGDINVSGTIYAGVKDFRIDHPLDPANKYLLHASVESSEMKNIYDGMVILDANGQAQINLPAWFEAVNGDFRYQLTAIGSSSPGLYIAQEISHGHFQIAGGMPGTKVSWQVTGVRKDAFAKANPLVVEQAKRPREQGFYLHPELYGAPEEKNIEWARNPQFMRRVKAVRGQQSAALESAERKQAAR